MSETSMRTLIVDDEPLARRGIRARLAAAGVETIGECDGGRAAIDAIRELAPDLVFLDVQMPEVDGFAVLNAIGAERMPIVIFVTAFDSHALHAFESHALDYLLKPIDGARFVEALA
nr:response regulator [Gemmatimonadota bacterium]